MIDDIVAFFAKKANADMLFFSIDGTWGSPWTTAPHNSSGAHRIVDQFVIMQADGLRYCEEVRLQFGDRFEHAVVITDLPEANQIVVMLETRQRRKFGYMLETPTLVAIIQAMEAAQPLPISS